MRKIPTVFKRNPDDMKHVLREVNPGCEWVLAGEGKATRKYDGTCVLLQGGEWFARREVKAGKPDPEDFQLAEHDETTGKRVGWVPMESSSFARWHAEALEPHAGLAAALEPHAGLAAALGREVPEGTYELIGPKINGNPEGAPWHCLVRHETAEEFDIGVQERSYDGLRDLMAWMDEQGFEGLVWHHPDGRMAKLKVRDFDLSPASRDSQETT